MNCEQIVEVSVPQVAEQFGAGMFECSENGKRTDKSAPACKLHHAFVVIVIYQSEGFPRTRITKMSCACDCGRGPVSFSSTSSSFFFFFLFRLPSLLTSVSLETIHLPTSPRFHSSPRTLQAPFLVSSTMLLSKTSSFVLPHNSFHQNLLC